MYLRRPLGSSSSSGQIGKKGYTGLTALTKLHIGFQPQQLLDEAAGLPLTTSVFLLNRNLLLSSAAGLEELQAQRLHHGMSKFERASIDSWIGWRKLTDPGD